MATSTDAATTSEVAPAVPDAAAQLPHLPHHKAILACISKFEEEANVRVIFASESSSRTIGTWHQNSDHDIVAVYVHPRERYFSMEKIPTAVKKVFPPFEHDGEEVPEVEMVAWEARHAFARLADSTLALLDAFYSPLVYYAADIPISRKVFPGAVKVPPRETGTALQLPPWVMAVQDHIERLFDRVTLSWASWSQAATNFQEYVVRKPPNGVLVKKYMHVARRVLLNQWLQLYVERVMLLRGGAAGTTHSADGGASDDVEGGGGSGGASAAAAAAVSSGTSATTGAAQQHTQWPPPSLVLDLLDGVKNLHKRVQQSRAAAGGGGGGGGSGDGGGSEEEAPLPPPVPPAVVDVLQRRLEPSVRWQLGVNNPKIRVLDTWIEGEVARIKARLPKRRGPTTVDPAWDKLLVHIVREACEF